MTIRNTNDRKASFGEDLRTMSGPLPEESDAMDVRPGSTNTSDPNLEWRIINTTPVLELESLNSLPGEKSPPRDVSMLSMPHDHDGGSNSSAADQDCLVEDGEEHGVRLSQSLPRSEKGGAPARAPVRLEGPSVAAARMSPVEIDAIVEQLERIEQQIKEAKKQIHGTKGQGDEPEGLPSDDTARIAVPPPLAVGASASQNLQLLQTEGSQSDSDEQVWAHPSQAPEGSLLHALYLQLLAAGSEGITLTDLFTSFENQTAWRRYASDWRAQVRSHLTNDPHFAKVKGCYNLVCDDQRDVQRPKSSLANTWVSLPNTSGRRMPSASSAVRTSEHSTPAAVLPALSVDNHEGVQPRRKAYVKAGAAIRAQATMDSEMLQQSTSIVQMASSVADPPDSQLATHVPLPTPRRKRKSSSSGDEELDDPCGSLQAMPAQILAETGEQEGEQCAWKEDASKWRCRRMAMAGHTLCEHHRNSQPKNSEERTKTQENRSTGLSPGKPAHLGALQVKIVASEKGVQGGERRAQNVNDGDGTGTWRRTRSARRWEDQHRTKEDKKALHRAAEQQMTNATTMDPNASSSNMGLPESHTQLDQVLQPHPPSAPKSSPMSPTDTRSHAEAAKSVDEHGEGNSKDDEDHADTHAQRMRAQMLKTLPPKKRYVAARKSAAHEGAAKVKSQGQESAPLTRPPTIPPLPPSSGVRTKAVTAGSSRLSS